MDGELQKNAECTIGILKGRFRILKTGIRLEGPQTADNVWLTCCALHNLLLEVDGLDKEWEHGISSDWEGELGNNDPDEIRLFAPMAIQRLVNPEMFGSREHERASELPQPLLGIEEEEEEEEEDATEVPRQDEDGATVVNALHYDEFRKKLVTHFDIAFSRGEVKWPRSKETEIEY